MSYIEERAPIFLPCPQRTLGVLARGTDYVNTKFHNHSVHATKEMLANKIDEVWEVWGGFDHIYIATEDQSYIEYFRSRYGEKVCFTDQERFTINQGEQLSDIHWRKTDKRDGFRLGAEYILSINLLARCRALIASGGCGGLGEAMKENQGRYEHTYVFDLGVNE